MKGSRMAALAAALAAAVTGQSAAARAGDIQGDAYGCEELWVMRNQVFKDNGYCFATEKARSHFGNGGCRYHDEGSVPLSRSERSLIRDIRKSERRQGC